MAHILPGKIDLLVNNPAHPSLKCHRVKRISNAWIAYINRKNRLLFRRLEGRDISLLDVRAHCVVDRFSGRTWYEEACRGKLTCACARNHAVSSTTANEIRVACVVERCTCVSTSSIAFVCGVCMRRKKWNHMCNNEEFLIDEPEWETVCFNEWLQPCYQCLTCGALFSKVTDWEQQVCPFCYVDKRAFRDLLQHMWDRWK